MKSFKQSRRLFCLLVLTFFISNSLFPFSGYSAENVELAFAGNRFVSSIQIPAELGEISEIAKSPRPGPVIIHLQTAHGHFEAQKNIEAILKFLEKNYGIRHLYLEGASAKLKPELFRFFPEEPALSHSLIESLVKEGELTGAEAFLIRSSQIARGQGVENLQAFLRNRKVFEEVLGQKKMAGRFLDAFQKEWKKTATRLLSPDLKQFLRRFDAYESGLLSYPDWILDLSKMAQARLDLDLEDVGRQIQWPYLVRYFRLQKSAASLDLSKIEIEKAVFLKALESFQVAPVLREEIRAALEEKTPSAQNENPFSKTRLLFEHLMDGLPADFTFQPYPNLALWIEKIILLEEMSSKGLYEEMNRLKDEVFSVLAKTEAEKKMLRLYENGILLKKLFSLEWTREDYEFYAARKKVQSPSEMFQVLNARWPDLKQAGRLFRQSLYFYQGAFRREHWLFQNSARQMRAAKIKKAVLVTGGFHAEGLRGEMLKAGFSYVGIRPRMTEIDSKDRQTYLRAALGTSPVSKSKIEIFLRTAANFFRQSPRLASHARNIFLSTGKFVIEDYARQQGFPENKRRGLFLDFQSKIDALFAGRSELRSSKAVFIQASFEQFLTLMQSVLPARFSPYVLRYPGRTEIYSDIVVDRFLSPSRFRQWVEKNSRKISLKEAIGKLVDKKKNRKQILVPLVPDKVALVEREDFLNLVFQSKIQIHMAHWVYEFKKDGRVTARGKKEREMAVEDPHLKDFLTEQLIFLASSILVTELSPWEFLPENKFRMTFDYMISSDRIFQENPNKGNDVFARWILKRRTGHVGFYDQELLGKIAQAARMEPEEIERFLKLNHEAVHRAGRWALAYAAQMLSNPQRPVLALATEGKLKSDRSILLREKPESKPSSDPLMQFMHELGEGYLIVPSDIGTAIVGAMEGVGGSKFHITLADYRRFLTQLYVLVSAFRIKGKKGVPDYFDFFDITKNPPEKVIPGMEALLKRNHFFLPEEDFFASPRRARDWMAASAVSSAFNQMSDPSKQRFLRVRNLVLEKSPEIVPLLTAKGLLFEKSEAAEEIADLWQLLLVPAGIAVNQIKDRHQAMDKILFGDGKKDKGVVNQSPEAVTIFEFFFNEFVPIFFKKYEALTDRFLEIYKDRPHITRWKREFEATKRVAGQWAKQHQRSEMRADDNMLPSVSNPNALVTGRPGKDMELLTDKEKEEIAKLKRRAVLGSLVTLASGFLLGVAASLMPSEENKKEIAKPVVLKDWREVWRQKGLNIEWIDNPKRRFFEDPEIADWFDRAFKEAMIKSSRGRVQFLRQVQAEVWTPLNGEKTVLFRFESEAPDLFGETIPNAVVRLGPSKQDDLQNVLWRAITGKWYEQERRFTFAFKTFFQVLGVGLGIAAPIVYFFTIRRGDIPRVRTFVPKTLDDETNAAAAGSPKNPPRSELRRIPSSSPTKIARGIKASFGRLSAGHLEKASVPEPLKEFIRINEGLGGGSFQAVKKVIRELTGGIISMASYAVKIYSFLAVQSETYSEKVKSIIARALAILGINTKISYAYVLGARFAIDDEGIVSMRTVFGDSPAVVMIAKGGKHEKRDRRIVEQFNRELETLGRPAIDLAENWEEAKRKLNQAILSRQKGPFVFHEIVNQDDRSLAGRLKKEIPVLTRILPGMHQRFFNVVSPIAEGLMAKFRAISETVTSA
ncbi:MAG: hypothetical protein HYZ83_05715 [Candidatus Omnitrophica bacterium]|nr:hypothetical protein [Candidatus Omnitrophota bacterium]